MASSHRLLLLASLSAVALANFQPRPFHHFAEDGLQRGVRHFSNEENHLLEGGTTLQLRWNAHVEPETILMLDLEGEKGVKLASCQPNQLVLHLPASHVEIAKGWKHVTASEEIHGCPHLTDHPLYHRIESREFTKHPDMPKGGATLVLSTTELYSVSQVLPNAQFIYGVTPIDSLHPDLQEEARRSYEIMKADQERLSARRLQVSAVAPEGSPFAIPAAFKANLSALDGFKKSFKKSIGQVTLTNKLSPKKGETGGSENWKPMTHANFGWNWNYHTNATRNPQFKFSLPGMRGYVLMKNPYLKFLGSCQINFTSHWDEVNPFAKPPIVKFAAAFAGNAYLNADLSLMANIYRDVTENPFGRIPQKWGDIALLNKYTKETHYFNKVKFLMAGIPVSLQPGVSVNLNAYHLGLFKGAVRLGINCHLLVSATAVYDSTSSDAIATTFKAEALNVRMLPPTWMIYTKHLEFGAILTPAFWLKGSIGPVRDATLELQLRPYCNVSIIQEGEQAYGVQQRIVEKELIVMPFRAINLAIGSEWSVGIEANGRRIMTSTELSLGVVEFHDYVQHFRFGLINQRKLLKDAIYVALFKNGVKQAGEIVAINCDSVVEGECIPAPYNAMFTIDGKTVVVQLTIAWHSRPVEYLMSKVRSMSFVFPQLALSPEASKDYLKNKPTTAFIRITRNGREYKSYQNPKVVSNLVVFEATQTTDLGINWIDAWRIKYGSISGEKAVTNLIDPLIELVYVRNGQEEQAASTFMPAVNWDSVFLGASGQQGKETIVNGGMGGNNANMLMKTLLSGIGNVKGENPRWGTPNGGMGNSANVPNSIQRGEFKNNPQAVWRQGFFQGNVPMTISLSTNTGKAWADGHMGLDVHNVHGSSRWMRPYRTEKWVQGSVHSLYWTVRGAQPGKAENFRFVALKVDQTTGSFQPPPPGAGDKQLTGLKCEMGHMKAKRFEWYGDECVFKESIHIDPGMVGLTMVFMILWRDHGDKTTHKMLSAPVQLVSSLSAVQQQQGAAQGFVAGSPPRLLDDNDWAKHKEGDSMVAAPPDSDHEIEIQMDEVPFAEDAGPKKSADSRRLQQYGYQPTNISFEDKMNELHPICSRKPLHYEIGAGVFLRAKMHNLNMQPDGAPGTPSDMGFITNAIESVANMANLNTIDVPLANTELGKKLSTLFPKGLCSEGVCDGTLPGCPGQMVHPVRIPKVEFKMNRALNWNNNTQAEAKHATAYAMALLPELIRVTSIVVTNVIPHSSTFSPSLRQNNPYYHSGNVVQYNGHTCRWTRVAQCAAVFNYRGISYTGCSVQDHHNRGWCSVDKQFQGNWHNCQLTCSINGADQVINNPSGKIINPKKSPSPMGALLGVFGGRRLEEDKKQPEKDSTESDRIMIELEPGSVSYKVDEDLIHTLLRRQAFRGIEDGRERQLGAAKIVAFRLHHGDSKPSTDDSDMIPVGPEQKFEVDFTKKDIKEKKAGSSDEHEQFNNEANIPLSTLVAGFAVLATAAFVAGVARVRHSQMQPYETVEDSELEASATPIIE